MNYSEIFFNTKEISMSVFKDIISEDFQFAVENTVKDKDKNILDIITELNRSASRVQSCLIYASSRCGCIKLSSDKSGITGELCEKCRYSLELELGGVMFSIAALCSFCNVSMYDVLLTEKRYIELMGNYLLI